MARKNHAIDRHLGTRVRFARVEKKISQTVLGEKLGISFQQVQKYELGKDRISASQLMSIARILEKDISFFFEDIDDEANDSSASLTEAGGARRKLRSNAVYDIKIIRLLHAVEDEKLKIRLYGLIEAIVESRHGRGGFDAQALMLSADREGETRTKQ